VQLRAVAARRRVHTSTETAVASADGRPTISAMRAIGPPIAQGPMLMRTGDPMIAIGLPRYTRAIVLTSLLPATVHNDAPTITAIATQTFDERLKTRGMASGGTTRGVHMRPRAPPIPFLPRTDTPIGRMIQGATGRVLRRVTNATTARAVRSHELRRQAHAVRPGTMIVSPSALIAVADPLPCK
jgi:hypothetical protein